MAWQRAGQLSAETQTLADVAGLGAKPTISSAQKYTGGYSYLSNGTNTDPFGITGLSSFAVRCNFMLRHNDVSSHSNYAPLIGMIVDGANLIFWWQRSSGILQLEAGYTISTNSRRYPVEIISNAFASPNTWYSIGMIANMAGSGGFVTLYVDGQQTATWTGDTRLYRSNQSTPRTQIDSVYVVGLGYGTYQNVPTTHLSAFANPTYIDDFYADQWSGETAPADYPPSTRRFVPAFPISDTATADWTPNTGSDHFAMADEAPPDDDTTRLKADGPGLTDIFNFSTVAVPSPDWSVRAAIVTAYARKTDANFDSTLRLVQEYDGVVQESDERQLGISYNNVWARWETPPGEETWTEARINQAQFGIRSDGSFSDYG